MSCFRLTCCGESVSGAALGSYRDFPPLAFWLEMHAGHGMEVVEFERERLAPQPSQRPKAKPRTRGPQRELALG